MRQGQRTLRARLWVAQLLILTALSLGLGGCERVGELAPLSEPVVHYDGAWEYRYGESPRLSDGRWAWAMPDHNDGGWQPTKIVHKPPGRKKDEPLWLRSRVLSPPIKDAVFYVRSVDEDYEGYFDGRPLGVVGRFKRDRSTLSSTKPMFLRLGDNPAGKMLVIRLYSPTRLIGLSDTGQYAIGGRAELINYLYVKGLRRIFIGTFLLTTGLFTVALFFLRRQETNYLYYSCFSFFLGVYLICRTELRHLIYENPNFWWVLDISSLCLVVMFLGYFYNAIFGSGYRQIRRWVPHMFLLYFIAASILVAARLVPLMWFLFPLQVLILIELVVLTSSAVFIALKGNSDATLIAVGWVLASMPATYELLGGLGIIRKDINTIEFSSVLFVFSLGIVLAKRFVLLHRRMRDHSAMMQLSLASTSALDATEHARAALEQVLKLLRGERALLFLVRAGGELLELFVGLDDRGNTSSTWQDYDSPIVDSVKQRYQARLATRIRPRPQPRIGTDGDADGEDAEQIIVAMPMLAQQQFLGVIYLEVDPKKRSFTREDIEVLAALTNQIAMSLLSTRALRLEVETTMAQRRLAEQGALLDAAARMARGDLTSTITVPEGSELAQLAQALDAMRRDLQSKLHELETSHAEVQELNVELRRQIEQRSRHVLELALKSDQAPAARSFFDPGAMLGEHYRVIRLLGQGAMGSVFEVERTTDGRHLAAKVLAARADKTTKMRFAREAQLLARLKHPSLISIVDVDMTATGVLYLVMELVRGTTLKLCQERYGDARFAFPVLRQIAEGLAAIHSAGIIHRDLKPANVLIAEAGGSATPVVKLVDFGLSTLSQAGANREDSIEMRINKDGPPEDPKDDKKDEQVRSGFVVGTPMYMAPECSDRVRSARPPTDIYSFGLIAYELLTGELPFERPPIALALKGEPLVFTALRSARSDLPAELTRLIDSCLAEDPSARPDANSLAARLASLLRLS